MSTSEDKLDVEQAVLSRYSAASASVQPSLCCPVNFEAKYLEVLPDELIERDYGCGDPSQAVEPGDVVLDLGSGGGKICYIASQIVGAEGRVIGVDMNDEMLELARKYQSRIAAAIGWDNVTFHKGRIQDLALDVQRFEDYLAEHPVTTASGWAEAQKQAEWLRAQEPMIADESVDVVLSNCVLNLVREDDRRNLFHEIHRVLRRGGRAVISDIVSDEHVPARLRNDPELWSGCISGAFQESEFLEAFENAGLYGVEILNRQEEPWATVEGIEFRSLTVRAYKGKEGACWDHHQAVVYRGPWKSVTDDDGHTYRRGERMAVCEKTFQILTRPPYGGEVIGIEPRQPVSAEQARPMNCDEDQVRPSRVTKGTAPRLTQLPTSDCCGDSDCC